MVASKVKTGFSALSAAPKPFSVGMRFPVAAPPLVNSHPWGVCTGTKANSAQEDREGISAQVSMVGAIREAPHALELAENRRECFAIELAYSRPYADKTHSESSSS